MCLKKLVDTDPYSLDKMKTVYISDGIGFTRLDNQRNVSPTLPWCWWTRGILRPPAWAYARMIRHSLYKWRYRCRTTGGSVW